MDRGYFDECQMCGNPQHFEEETQALMPIARKKHTFYGWREWRGEKKDQPCTICGYTLTNKHHTKEEEVEKVGRRSTHL
jgi:hypothetical protein